MILSEKLRSFSIQQRNYVVLLGKTIGRGSFFFILPFSTRRFLNFLITSVILILSTCTLIISFLVSEDSLNLIGIFFTGTTCSVLIESSYLHLWKLFVRTYFPIHCRAFSIDCPRICNRILDSGWKFVCLSDSLHGADHRENARTLCLRVCPTCFVFFCNVILFA